MKWQIELREGRWTAASPAFNGIVLYGDPEREVRERAEIISQLLFENPGLTEVLIVRE